LDALLLSPLLVVVVVIRDRPCCGGHAGVVFVCFSCALQWLRSGAAPDRLDGRWCAQVAAAVQGELRDVGLGDVAKDFIN
jgi:hypothetical protein